MGTIKSKQTGAYLATVTCLGLLDGAWSVRCIIRIVMFGCSGGELCECDHQLPAALLFTSCAMLYCSALSSHGQRQDDSQGGVCPALRRGDEIDNLRSLVATFCSESH